VSTASSLALSTLSQSSHIRAQGVGDDAGRLTVLEAAQVEGVGGNPTLVDSDRARTDVGGQRGAMPDGALPKVGRALVPEQRCEVRPRARATCAGVPCRRPGQTRPGWTRPGQTRPGQTRPGQTRPGRTRPGPGGGAPAAARRAGRRRGSRRTPRAPPRRSRAAGDPAAPQEGRPYRGARRLLGMRWPFGDAIPSPPASPHPDPDPGARTMRRRGPRPRATARAPRQGGGGPPRSLRAGRPPRGAQAGRTEGRDRCSSCGVSRSRRAMSGPDGGPGSEAPGPR